MEGLDPGSYAIKAFSGRISAIAIDIRRSEKRTGCKSCKGGRHNPTILMGFMLCNPENSANRQTTRCATLPAETRFPGGRLAGKEVRL
jgi:hypothetical protein